MIVLKVRVMIPTYSDKVMNLNISQVPTFLAFSATMRQRGAHFSGVGLGGGETGERASGTCSAGTI